MKKEKLLIAGLAFLSIAAIAAPYVASANRAEIKSNVFDVTILKGPLLICQGNLYLDNKNTVNPNACVNLCDFVAQVANIIYFMIALIIWIIAPALVATGGIMYMLAGPNPDMVGRAKKTLTSVAWGLAIVLSAWLIVYTFVGALGNLSSKVGGFGGPNGQAACSISQ
jgi:hypothetical protein